MTQLMPEWAQEPLKVVLDTVKRQDGSVHVELVGVFPLSAAMPPEPPHLVDRAIAHPVRVGELFHNHAVFRFRAPDAERE